MIPVGYKFGTDWAEKTNQEKAERLAHSSPIRKASHSKKKRICCLCESRLMRGQTYRQANGSVWLGHEDCVQANLPSKNAKQLKLVAAELDSTIDIKEAKPVTLSVKPSQEDLEEAEKSGFFRAILLMQGLPDRDDRIIKAMIAAAEYRKR